MTDHGPKLDMTRTAHRPPWQKQPPPQSMLPFRHSSVHMVFPQLGPLVVATHDVAWQQVAGTQSESF